MTFQVSTLSQKDHVIIQITDTHLLEYPHLEFVGMNPEESFHAIIQQILKNILKLMPSSTLEIWLKHQRPLPTNVIFNICKR